MGFIDFMEKVYEEIDPTDCGFCHFVGSIISNLPDWDNSRFHLLTLPHNPAAKQSTDVSSNSKPAGKVEIGSDMERAELLSKINELQNEIFSLIDDKTIHTVTRSKSTYALPGFRTKTPWKMIVASASYLFISYLCLTLTVENTYGGALWLERIFCIIMMHTIVFGCFDYRNIQKLMPLCQYQNRLVRYVGIALLDFLLVFILLTVMIICESIFFK